MYSKILNPKTNKWVNVNGIIGKKIIKQYIMLIHGGADTVAVGTDDDDTVAVDDAKAKARIDLAYTYDEMIHTISNYFDKMKNVIGKISTSKKTESGTTRKINKIYKRRKPFMEKLLSTITYMRDSFYEIMYKDIIIKPQVDKAIYYSDIFLEAAGANKKIYNIHKQGGHLRLSPLISQNVTHPISNTNYTLLNPSRNGESYNVFELFSKFLEKIRDEYMSLNQMFIFVEEGYINLSEDVKSALSLLTLATLQRISMFYINGNPPPLKQPRFMNLLPESKKQSIIKLTHILKKFLSEKQGCLYCSRIKKMSLSGICNSKYYKQHSADETVQESVSVENITDKQTKLTRELNQKRRQQYDEIIKKRDEENLTARIEKRDRLKLALTRNIVEAELAAKAKKEAEKEAEKKAEEDDDDSYDSGDPESDDDPDPDRNRKSNGSTNSTGSTQSYQSQHSSDKDIDTATLLTGSRKTAWGQNNSA